MLIVIVKIKYDISNNSHYHGPIFNFKNQIPICNFDNTDISCYEPFTCENINNNKYNKCNRNDNHRKIFKIVGFILILSYGCGYSCWCIYSLRHNLNDETSSYLSDDYNTQQDVDILPDYNEVVNIPINPPCYTDNDTNTNSSRNHQNEPHLPTYEESMDITNLSNHIFIRN
ncbi:hypothetical protein PIROE2DRAFT_4744 [Piromyces sp. E2]|nr:hypothetical protein PIROE2DRAFT_4744 [Piromyces sp. E2]|eukprot:OUM67690.1 hypothetical protein PIROE2DRAFT_4744 [Piromyces sp. E2]